jgi:hypothetical protein
VVKNSVLRALRALKPQESIKIVFNTLTSDQDTVINDPVALRGKKLAQTSFTGKQTLVSKKLMK